MPTFTGTPGDDSLMGGFSNDLLMGLAGNDTLIPRAGSDTMDGGDGFDVVDYSTVPSGVTVNLSLEGPQPITFDKLDTLISIEGVIGSSARDQISGSLGNNTIFGGDLEDLIIDPGGTNYLRGDGGDDSIAGGPGFDDINGNQGNDTCASGGGDDWVVGGKDNDSLVGSAGQNLVYGNLGADTLDGGGGNDIVRGGQDSDTLMGGPGDDFVSGDKGDDTISGGAGADLFHTFGDAGLDRVLDFSLAEGDRVQLDPGTQFTVSQSGADTVINMTGGGQMVLVGVQMSTLTPGWIFGA